MGKKNGKKKGNIYEADRAMTLRVEDFLRVKVYGLHWQTRLKRDLGKVQEKIDKAPELLKGSIFAEQLPELIAQYEAEANELRKEYKARMDEAEKFTYTKADNALYDDYTSGDLEKLKAGIVSWFKAYSWDTTDTVFLDDCLAAISGLRQAKNSTIIKSVVYDEKGDARAVKFTEQRSKNDVLKTLYCFVAEKLIDLKLITAPWICSDVVAVYEKKSK